MYVGIHIICFTTTFRLIYTSVFLMCPDRFLNPNFDSHFHDIFPDIISMTMIIIINSAVAVAAAIIINSK